MIYQILVYIIHKKTLYLKYMLQHGMKNFNYLTDGTLYQILKNISSLSLKKHETVTDNSLIRICENKKES